MATQRQPLRPKYIAIVGPGERATEAADADALIVGRAVAERGWILLCGGRSAGVMAAAARGATEAGGVSIGILPGTDRAGAAPQLTVSLPTGLGESRNAVLVTAADAVIACGMNPGTASEVSLALRAQKPVVLVRPAAAARAFFMAIAAPGVLHTVKAPEDALSWLEREFADS